MLHLKRVTVARRKWAWEHRPRFFEFAQLDRYDSNTIQSLGETAYVTAPVSACWAGNVAVVGHECYEPPMRAVVLPCLCGCSKESSRTPTDRDADGDSFSKLLCERHQGRLLAE